jgi:superfamily II DNA helicase RecQ
MPRSIENYVQETGRAGRDGLPSLCVALMDDSDFIRTSYVMFNGFNKRGLGVVSHGRLRLHPYETVK